MSPTSKNSFYGMGLQRMGRVFVNLQWTTRVLHLGSITAFLGLTANAASYHSYPAGDVYQGPAHVNELLPVEVVVRYNPYASSATLPFSQVYQTDKPLILHFATTYCPVADENVKKLKEMADANADVQFLTIIPYNNQDGECFAAETVTEPNFGASLQCSGDGGKALYYVEGFSYLWSGNVQGRPLNYKLLQDTPYVAVSGMTMNMRGEFYSKFGVSTANGESWHTKEQVVAFTKSGNNFGMMYPQRRSGSQGIVGMQWDAYDTANGGPKSSGVMLEDVQALLTAVKADTSNGTATATPTPSPSKSPSPSPSPSPSTASATTTAAPLGNVVFNGKTKLTFTATATCSSAYLSATLGPSVVKGLASFLGLSEDRVALASAECVTSSRRGLADAERRKTSSSTTVSGDFGYQVSGFASTADAQTSSATLQQVTGAGGAADTQLVNAVNTALAANSVTGVTSTGAQSDTTAFSVATAASGSSSGDDDGLGGGMIALIVILLLLAVGGIGFATVYLLKKKQAGKAGTKAGADQDVTKPVVASSPAAAKKPTAGENAKGNDAAGTTAEKIELQDVSVRVGEDSSAQKTGEEGRQSLGRQGSTIEEQDEAAVRIQSAARAKTAKKEVEEVRAVSATKAKKIARPGMKKK